MKIIEDSFNGFKPVHLVLESQGEVDLFAALLGACSGDADKTFNVDTMNMYTKLEDKQIIRASVDVNFN